MKSYLPDHEGYLSSNILLQVAVFDVNHNFGFYFVTPQDLYRAVNT